AVVVGGNRGQAASADGGDCRPLGLDPEARRRVVCCRDALLLPGTHLQRERALPRPGQELGGIEATADLVREAEPVEAAGREDDGVEPALGALAQARVDVAAKRLDRQRRLEREQLR